MTAVRKTNSSRTTVTSYYLDGIKEGREMLNKYGASIANDALANINATIKKGFAASSPVGQLLRGERDFWRNAINKKRGKS